jgi:plastocyanin
VTIKRNSLAAVAAVSLLLAACGDDDTESSGAPATDPASPTAAATDTTSGGVRGDYGPSDGESSVPATDATDSTGGDAAAAAEIVITDFAFSDDITVPVGTTITIRNDDGAGHTMTADDGAFDPGTIDGGSTVELTLTEAGTFTFHCEIHPSMTGTITVTA